MISLGAGTGQGEQGVADCQTALVQSAFAMVRRQGLAGEPLDGETQLGITGQAAQIAHNEPGLGHPAARFTQ